MTSPKFSQEIKRLVHKGAGSSCPKAVNIRRFQGSGRGDCWAKFSLEQKGLQRGNVGLPVPCY